MRFGEAQTQLVIDDLGVTDGVGDEFADDEGDVGTVALPAPEVEAAGGVVAGQGDGGIEEGAISVSWARSWHSPG